MGFSMPLGRTLLAVSLVLLIVHSVKSRSLPRMPVTGWLWLSFVALAFVVTWYGVNPALGLKKFPKIAWFIGIPIAATLVCTRSRLMTLIGAFCAGTTVMALWVFVRNPIQAAAAVREHIVPDFAGAIVHVAGMADAQRLMIGVVATLGLLLWMREEKMRGGRVVAVCLVLQAIALVMTFKRGAWMAAVAMVALMLILRTNWKCVVGMLLLVGAVCLVPAVQSRLAALAKEFTGGGRIVMWTRVAPKLLMEHPRGIGYMSLTNRMMRAADPTVERNRNHLHSNPVQVVVETGLLGLGLYLLWMMGGVLDCVGFARSSHCRRTGETAAAVILLLMLGGLLLNGLVEYNFGDAELIVPYGIIMGCAAAGRKRAAGTEGLRGGVA